ncbi:hypothetical protein E2C01_077237 [Portunus trituberculatus]|uniref:Uncharacterized protein n=1 Tax=Portunus trituberculatus TaxID=210409 RepID=A0A5B7IQU7_PORTR|nr:hypothetical protein [Portunus trituberculatus]
MSEAMRSGVTPTRSRSPRSLVLEAEGGAEGRRKNRSGLVVARPGLSVEECTPCLQYTRGLPQPFVFRHCHGNQCAREE